MFGSRSKELSSMLLTVKLDLEKANEEKAKLQKELDYSKSRVKELEGKIAGSSIPDLEESMKVSIAEYEGLKKLYEAKIKEFEDSRVKQEQEFAREAALARHNLENEIAGNRRDNENFVADTVNNFSETYNYYLNQIKVLMDALGQVAQQAGKTLFQGDVEALKANFSQQLVDALKSGTDKLTGAEGELIVIGASEGHVDTQEARPETEKSAEVTKEAVEEAAQAVEKTAEAVEKTAEAAQDTVTEAAEKAAKTIDQQQKRRRRRKPRRYV